MKKKIAAPRKRRTSIEAMKRQDVIEALRSQLPPSTFHLTLTWSTAMLKALLAYYREEDKAERTFPKVGAKHIPVKCGCGAPWAHTGKHFPENLLEEIRKEDTHSIERDYSIANIEAIRPLYRRNWYGKKILIGFETRGVIHRKRQ